MMRWPRRKSAALAAAPAPPARRVPAALVVRSVRKALGAPGTTGAAVGLAVGLVLGLALAAVLLSAKGDT
ncbi:hypothetical protein [Streptomyces sp. NPDC048157]|uniref:hypothetical protein n=1 Tax=Streptomyces sp. NPDC048157 TaxID=3365503 RepID=UPI0037160205